MHPSVSVFIFNTCAECVDVYVNIISTDMFGISDDFVCVLLLLLSFNLTSISLTHTALIYSHNLCTYLLNIHDFMNTHILA